MSHDDTRIRALLRDWLEVYRQAQDTWDDDALNAAGSRLNDIETAIAEIPASSGVGLAMRFCDPRQWIPPKTGLHRCCDRSSRTQLASCPSSPR